MVARSDVSGEVAGASAAISRGRRSKHVFVVSVTVAREHWRRGLGGKAEGARRLEGGRGQGRGRRLGSRRGPGSLEEEERNTLFQIKVLREHEGVGGS